MLENVRSRCSRLGMLMTAWSCERKSDFAVPLVLKLTEAVSESFKTTDSRPALAPLFCGVRVGKGAHQPAPTPRAKRQKPPARRRGSELRAGLALLILRSF